MPEDWRSAFGGLPSEQGLASFRIATSSARPPTTIHPMRRSGIDGDAATINGHQCAPADDSDHQRTARDENGPSEDVVSGADPGANRADLSQIFYT
jgi:hypothetical protein